MHRFRDRVVLITGAASGIGRTMACRFATEGAKVVVADISEEGAADTLWLRKHRIRGCGFFRSRTRRLYG